MCVGAPVAGKDGVLQDAAQPGGRVGRRDEAALRGRAPNTLHLLSHSALAEQPQSCSHRACLHWAIASAPVVFMIRESCVASFHGGRCWLPLYDQFLLTSLRPRKQKGSRTPWDTAASRVPD